MTATKTQIAIIGAGPSGLLLALLLRSHGLDCVVLERRSRAYVEARVRAGVLESGTAELLVQAGADARMRREGLIHDGFVVAFDGHSHRIDVKALAAQHVVVYGQTELQKDLAETLGEGTVVWEAEDVAIEEVTGPRPRVSYTRGGQRHELSCDFIGGCDGWHGVCRSSVPRDRIQHYERLYPFGWLGVLADVPPVSEELVYASHARGFALCSMRSRTRSRYYLQCPVDDSIESWPDERFWDELRARLPSEHAAHLATGPAIEKSIVPLRSLVAEPMRFGRLFLVGDAAHIVPPTGAKGLNLAAADVRVLYQALVQHYKSGADTLLDAYSDRAVARVWMATRFSWWFTTFTHKFSDEPLARKLQLAEFNYLSRSHAASQAMAENYVGLPFG